MTFDIRPMTLADLDGVTLVHQAAEEQLERQAGTDPDRGPTPRGSGS